MSLRPAEKAVALKVLEILGDVNLDTDQKVVITELFVKRCLVDKTQKSARDILEEIMATQKNPVARDDQKFVRETLARKVADQWAGKSH